MVERTKWMRDLLGTPIDQTKYRSMHWGPDVSHSRSFGISKEPSIWVFGMSKKDSRHGTNQHNADADHEVVKTLAEVIWHCAQFLGRQVSQLVIKKQIARSISIYRG
ncbi:hypothetical protein Tco_1494206 [Tanacetum coccineum]